MIRALSSLFVLAAAVAGCGATPPQVPRPDVSLLAHAISQLGVRCGDAQIATALTKDGAQVRPRARWLLRLWRPILRVPVDIALLTGVVLRQLVRRDRQVGGLRAIPFSAVGDDAVDQARRAIAEGAGSFAPNTVVIGVDADRNLLIAHQLVHTKKARTSLDPLELG